jgi:hypothetical protein
MFKKTALNDEEKEHMQNKEGIMKEREESIRQTVEDKNGSKRKDMFVVDVPKSWSTIINYKKIPIKFYKVVLC